MLYKTQSSYMSRLVRLSGPLLTAAIKINPVTTDASNQHFLCVLQSKLS
jgi:hypothetical protein